MLSTNMFSETRIQQLLDDLFFVEKCLSMHVQCMLNMNRDLYTSGKFKQLIWKKNEGKLVTLFAIMI